MSDYEKNKIYDWSTEVDNEDFTAWTKELDSDEDLD